MSEHQQEWEGAQLGTSIKMSGQIDISQRLNHTGSGGSTLTVTVKNFWEKALEIKFDWYNISEEEKNKRYIVPIDDEKEIIVPNQRRITVLWRPC